MIDLFNLNTHGRVRKNVSVVGWLQTGRFTVRGPAAPEQQSAQDEGHVCPQVGAGKNFLPLELCL